MRDVRIFVSSPNDVHFERQRVDLVAARLSNRFDGVRIVPYRWENGHYFSAHDSFQSLIPATAEFDIVVGIVWSRIGSAPPSSFPPMPDGRPYPSGTAYEILTAIAHRQTNALPDILFYRKRELLAVDPDAERITRAGEEFGTLKSFLDEWFFTPAEGFKASFLDFRTTDEFESLLEANLEHWLRAQDWFGGERDWQIEEAGSPFVGLNAFEEKHRDFFFGRDRETARCIELINGAATRGTAFLLIEGASGTGKSSLVRAGILPTLMLPRSGQPERLCAIVDPGEDPLAALAAALVAGLPDLATGDYPTPAALAVHLAAGGGIEPVLRALDRIAVRRQAELNADAPVPTELLLLVDQFEQLFASRLDSAARDAFLLAMDRLARSGRVRVLVTLRADAGGAARALPRFAALVNDGAALTLAAPQGAALESAITGPAKSARIAFERQDGVSLDERLFAEAAAPDALPLLQFTLEQLYDQAEKSPDAARAGGNYATFRFADYEAMGGISGAIGQHAAKAYGKATVDQRARLSTIVRALIAAGSDATLLLRTAPYAEATRDEDGRVLADDLVAARILVRDGDMLRFAHQRVLDAWAPAREAAEAARTMLRVRDEVTPARDRWLKDGKTPDLLIPKGVRLAEAEREAAAFPEDFSALGDYITASSVAARAEEDAKLRDARRRVRIFAALAFLALVFAGGAGWFYLVAEQNALQAERNAETARTESGLKTEALGKAESQKQRAEKNARAAEANAARAEQQARIATTNAEAAKAAQTRAEAEEAAKAAALSEAERERDRANQALRTSTEAANTLVFDLAQKFEKQGLPSDLTRAILEKARKLQDSLAANFPDDPRLQRSRAAALLKLSDLLALQGDASGALPLLQETLKILRALTQADPANTEWQRDVSVSLNKLGDLKLRAGDAAGALAAYEEGLGIRRALAQVDPANTGWATDAVVSLFKVATAADGTAKRAALAEAQERIEALEARGVLTADQQGWPDMIRKALAEAGGPP